MKIPSASENKNKSKLHEFLVAAFGGFLFVSDELEPKLSGSLKNKTRTKRRLNVRKGYEFTHEQR